MRLRHMLELTGGALILVLRLTLVGLPSLFLGWAGLVAVRVLRRLARLGSGTHQPTSPARLVVVEPGATRLAPGAAFPLRPITRLGRSPESTIVLDDTFVSGDHAVIVRRDGGWWIADQGSTNGTAVNDQPVRGDIALSPGDVVVIGDVRLRLVL